jgi:sec-independent protein translocase protein TatC
MSADDQQGGRPRGPVSEGDPHGSDDARESCPVETGSPKPVIEEAPKQSAVATRPPARRPPAPPPPPSPADSGEEEDGMLRMSFLEHLEELRSRIIRALMGLAVAFVACVVFANQLWEIIDKPALIALKNLHFTPSLVQISPMDTFSIVWVKLPLLASIFVASPWILYQAWAFIAPGLYRRERRWAVPFVVCTAGLFIAGGLFAYFVAFRYGLEFLLGIGRDIAITPMVSINEYFDLFVNVMLGIGLVFELPVLIFFLTLLRIVSPSFLMKHSRYAILAIVILAAIVTPTPDVFNLMLFAVPMCALYFCGVFAGYLLVLRREKRSFPWRPVLIWTGIGLAVLGAALGVAMWRFGVHFVLHWPFLIR